MRMTGSETMTNDDDKIIKGVLIFAGVYIGMHVLCVLVGWLITYLEGFLA